MVAYDAPAAVGASLGAVRSQGTLTVGQCVTVGVGVAAALAAMHAERVAHGDVSAKCVFVDGKRVALAGTMSALEDGRTGASPADDVAALGPSPTDAVVEIGGNHFQCINPRFS